MAPPVISIKKPPDKIGRLYEKFNFLFFCYHERDRLAAVSVYVTAIL